MERLYLDQNVERRHGRRTANIVHVKSMTRIVAGTDESRTLLDEQQNGSEQNQWMCYRNCLNANRCADLIENLPISHSDNSTGGF